MRVSVIGAGYVGLVTGACLADFGHQISFLEASAERVGRLTQGTIPFFEPGLADLVTAMRSDGRLAATTQADQALDSPELILVCVGTPLAQDGEADLTQIERACADIRQHAPHVPVVIRSTLPLGWTSQLLTWLEQPDGRLVATNPEFLRQGSAIADFRHPTRIVIGTADGTDGVVTGLLRELYRTLEAPVLVTDFATAELIKNAANAFLAMKVSFVNEIADLSEAYAADIERVIEGIGLDPRIGGSYLKPGIGFGGSCLPKELANLVRLGHRRGLSMPLLESAGQVNDGRATRIADRLENLAGPVRGSRVAMLGLAFKPNTDDLRYSPALALAERLIARGADVIAHDPAVPVSHTDRVQGLKRADEPPQAIADSDIVVLATEWDAYRLLPWGELALCARRPFLFDGRNALDHDALRAAGWQVAGVGRPTDPVVIAGPAGQRGPAPVDPTR
jgi:UDPglucose 6-dehydrogenase